MGFLELSCRQVVKGKSSDENGDFLCLLCPWGWALAEEAPSSVSSGTMTDQEGAWLAALCFWVALNSL